MKSITVVTKSKHHDAYYMGKEKKKLLKDLKDSDFLSLLDHKSQEKQVGFSN